LMADIEREFRQVAILDFNGRKAVFTGTKAPEWRGEFVGEDYVVIGNLLAGKEVLDHMAMEFECSNGDLAWRMARALKAGSQSGGDKRGDKSAALIIANTEKVKIKLKVNMHGNPVEELCRQLKTLNAK